MRPRLCEFFSYVSPVLDGRPYSIHSGMARLAGSRPYAHGLVQSVSAVLKAPRKARAGVDGCVVAAGATPSTSELAQAIENTGGAPSSNCNAGSPAAVGSRAVLLATVANTLPSATAKVSSVVVPFGKVWPRVRSAQDQITLFNCRSPSSAACCDRSS